MSHEDLTPGLRFVQEYTLTQKEIEVIIPFLDKNYTTSELAELLEVDKKTLHHLIQRLKLKNLLVFKDKDSKGNFLYGINLKVD